MYVYRNANHVIITFHSPSYYDLFSLGPKLTLLPIENIISCYVIILCYRSYHVMLYIIYVIILCYIMFGGVQN